MEVFDIISKRIARFRFKLFRMASLVLLGRVPGQSVIGHCTSSDLEFANSVAVRNRIKARAMLSEATLQAYEFSHVPECWKVMFLRTSVFSRRFAYLLSDVVIGPESGVVFSQSSRFLGSDGIIFLPSIGHHYFYMQSGIQETMRRAKRINESLPVCPMPTIGYYHDMFEGLLNVVKATKTFGQIKVLVATCRPRHIDEMLDFLGIGADRIIYSSSPVLVKTCALIPRWNDCGENLKEDICEFRDILTSNLPYECCGSKRLYISRAKSRRPLPDEQRVEAFLATQGFVVAYFEEMSFVEQLMAVHSADVIVAPHGAGLANMVVARSGTCIIELMTHDWANSCYGHLAMILGLDYTCIDANYGDVTESLNQIFVNGSCV